MLNKWGQAWGISELQEVFEKMTHFHQKGTMGAIFTTSGCEMWTSPSKKKTFAVYFSAPQIAQRCPVYDVT